MSSSDCNADRRHLQLLFDAAAELLTAGEIRAFVEGVYPRIAQVIGLDGFFHYRTTDHVAGRLELAAYSGVDERTARSIRHLRFGEVVCGTVARDRRPIVVEDVQHATDPDTSLIRSLGVTAYACFPLMSAAGVHGTFSFFRRHGVQYAPDELSLLRGICDLIGLAWERQQAETALRDSETRFRRMADTAPAMLWITDTDGRCTFLSRGWYEYTGQPEAAGLDFGWLDAVHPDDRDETTRVFLEAVGQRETFSRDHRVRRSDGEYRWVLDEGRPQFSGDGEWRGFIGSVIDVHDRRLALEALRRSEARYRTLFDSMDEGFCIIEVLFDGDQRPVDYRFVETNPAFVKQTGLADTVGRRVRELLPDIEQHWIYVYGAVALTGEAIRFENGSDALCRWFDVFALPVEGPGSRKVALLFKDITEQKHADRERERLLRDAESAQAAAESANRAKAEFLAAMSHELRTPLNAIGGYVDLLDMGVHGPLEEAQRSALARITVNQRHLLTLINDILSFARLEANGIQLHCRWLPAMEILSSVESLVAPQAEAKGISYTVESCPPDLGFHADAERVRQILLNLVGNAIKFTPAGGRVTLSCVAEGDWTLVRVRDNGIGIAADEQERIFDPFQQLGRRLNQPQDGVGLGLAISRDLAQAMAGDLTVDSAPGEGSTFTLRLARRRHR
jgi:PAS domain S-box-containing protein